MSSIYAKDTTPGSFDDGNMMIIAGSDCCIVASRGGRDSFEDSALIMSHPNNPDFKLIAIADGIGGEKNGEVFSSLALNELSMWFSAFSVSDEINSNKDYHKEVQQSLKEAISGINKKLKTHLINGEGGTTLAVAVVCGFYTILLNIGDSRIYNYFGEALIPLTEDQKKRVKDCDNEGLTNWLPSDQRFRDSYCYIETSSLGYLVLCTDGAYTAFETKEDLLHGKCSLTENCIRVVEYAIQSPKADNATIASCLVNNPPVSTASPKGYRPVDDVKVWLPRKR